MIPVLPGPTAWLRSAFHPHQKPHVALRMCCNSISSSDAGASQLLKPPARRRSRHHMALSGSLTLRSRSFARVSRRCWCLLVAVYVCCSTSSLVSDVARPTDTKLGYCNPKVVLSLPLLAPLKTIYFQVRSLPPASPRSRMSAVSFPCTVGKIPTQIRDGSPHLHAGVGIFGQLTKLHRAKIASTARTAPPGLPAGQWARLAAGFLFTPPPCRAARPMAV